MKCPKCGCEMRNIMRFENGKNFAFHECNKCHTKTHQKRIHFDELGRNNNEDSSNTKRI